MAMSLLFASNQFSNIKKENNKTVMSNEAYFEGLRFCVSYLTFSLIVLFLVCTVADTNLS